MIYMHKIILSKLIIFQIILFSIYNLSYAGSYDRDSLTTNTNIHCDNQLSGDDISLLPGFFRMSDTWFTRGIIFRQSTYNSVAVKLDNVVLNSMIEGSFRGDILPCSLTDYVIGTTESDIFSNSEDLSAYINIQNPKIDTSFLKVIFLGGNIFGKSSLEHAGKHKYLRWSAAVDYITSPGFDLSKSKPDSLGSERKNSNFDKLSVKAGLEIFDHRSSLKGSFYYSQGKQNFPFSINSENMIFLKEPDFKLNLLNMEFVTLFDYNLRLNGNFFYLRTKSVLEKYDNSEMKSMLLPTSFVKTFEESKIGWNSSLFFDYDEIPAGKITFNYSRESLNYQPNQGFNIKHYELERLAVGILFAGNNDLWDYSLGSGLKILNPLTFYAEKMLSGYNDFEYFFNLGLNLTKIVKIKASLFRNIMLPQLYLLYPELNRFDISLNNQESTINNGFEFGLGFNFSGKSVIQIKYFNCQIENVQHPFALVEYKIDNLDYGINSQGIDFTGTFELIPARITVQTQYLFNPVSIYDSFVREYFNPEINFYADISQNYDFGFSWKISASAVRGRKSNSDSGWNQDDYAIVNIRLGQLIYNKNEIFIMVNNLTDAYYEIMKDMPMPGLFFAAGVRLIL